MMRLKRRELLGGAGATLATMWMPSWLAGCGGDTNNPPGCSPADHPLPADLPTYAHTGPLGPEATFSHGVVSGDPAADRVIVWTRVSPSDPTTSASLEVWWELALDPGFSRRVAQGTFVTDVARDFTVKVDATGLRPAVTYYYRFFLDGRESPIGRTRTAPSGPTSRARLAVMSCASYAHGYFHAYAKVAERADLDAVIHLGDYIYEYGTGEYGDVREYDPPHECLSLDDYRRRYRHYRLDANLQAVHRQHPFICVWDDHEVADNAYDGGAENHQPDEGSFADRFSAAKRAYDEYMPIRRQDGDTIHRTLPYGDLVDLVMLDTRNELRAKQLDAGGTDDPSRTLLGAEQEAWLETTLAASTARWVVLGQQVMMAQLSLDSIGHAPSNLDQWDGYGYARTRMLDAIEANAPGRTVVLTGDIHSSWACEVTRDAWNPAEYDPATGAGTIAVEFVTPGVTSPGFAEPDTGEDFFGGLVLDACPHIRWGNFTRRGYIVLDVDREKIQADFFHLGTILDPVDTKESVAASWAVMHGEPRLVAMDGPEVAPASCDPAP